MACGPGKRMQVELAEIERMTQAEKLNANITMVENDMMHLKGFIKGPPKSPYEGGKFEIDILIVKEYPFSPPKIRFTTRLWHPNVSLQL